MAAHLSLDERRIIATMLHRKTSVAKIALHLGRHRSTIHREIRRNFRHDPEVPMAAEYWPVSAQHLAGTRRIRQRKLIRYGALRRAVIDRLKAGWSPEQIAERLRLEAHGQSVCHETIYSYVYSAEGRARELGRHLPERRRKRKPRFTRKPRSLVFPERCMIRHRPEVVWKREAFDCGLEFVSWRELEKGLGAQAWFCDPQAPGKIRPSRTPIAASGAGCRAIPCC